MTDEVDELTDIEQDALAEIANMGVSRAANSLRQMVGEEVLLSVPAVKIVTRQAASKLVERNDATKLVAVQQSFEGPFAGRALLIFPEAQSLELVRAIVGDEHSLEDVIDLEQEALAETGNIILNGVWRRSQMFCTGLCECHCLPSSEAMERNCSRLTKRVQEDSLSCSCILILISRSATFTALSRYSWICRRSPP